MPVVLAQGSIAPQPMNIVVTTILGSLCGHGERGCSNGAPLRDKEQLLSGYRVHTCMARRPQVVDERGKPYAHVMANVRLSCRSGSNYSTTCKAK